MVKKPNQTFFLLGLLVPVSYFLSVNAFAQDAEAEEETEKMAIEEVIVTGTHIAGVDESVLPVTVMGAEAIEATGAVNMGEVLSFIPAVTDLEFEDNSNGTNSARGDVSSVALRGVPSAYTLTLLNGRRMVTWPTFQAQGSVPSTLYNVNVIPTSAVQRIEVLRRRLQQFLAAIRAILKTALTEQGSGLGK